MPNMGITRNKEKGTSIYIYIWVNVIMTSHGDVIGLMVNVFGESPTNGRKFSYFRVSELL
jgi:hypothetical protein